MSVAAFEVSGWPIVVRVEQGYRCYFVDEADHFVGREEFSACSDEAAERYARYLLVHSEYPGTELWHFGRFIRQFRKAV